MIYEDVPYATKNPRNKSNKATENSPLSRCTYLLPRRWIFAMVRLAEGRKVFNRKVIGYTSHVETAAQLGKGKLWKVRPSEVATNTSNRFKSSATNSQKIYPQKSQGLFGISPYPQKNKDNHGHPKPPTLRQRPITRLQEGTEVLYNET